MKYRQCCTGSTLLLDCHFVSYGVYPTTGRECCRELKGGILHIQSLSFFLFYYIPSCYRCIQQSTRQLQDPTTETELTPKHVKKFRGFSSSFFFYSVPCNSNNNMQSHGTRGNFWCFCFVARSSLLSFFLQGGKKRIRKWTDTFPNVFTARGKVLTLGLLL